MAVGVSGCFFLTEGIIPSGKVKKMDPMFGLTTLLFGVAWIVVAIFFAVWPVLIWLHLREQTKYLKQIAESINSRQHA